ncbi:PAS domain-containing methyl-accepting chemotaxis protein [Nocardioides sp. GY 10127]|uniref:methyl-accepting chemotaxis protein n=1 Tax=Nocardioides sp. GY 10127 TaxID=2569762 RepID=UPI0010A79EEB|nr:PAS domain S-box protein [Nocardioides sp. GY 10127]
MPAAASPLPDRAPLDAGALVAALTRSSALLRLDTDGTIVGVDEKLARLLGYIEEDLVGQPHTMLLSSAVEREWELVWRRILLGEQVNSTFARQARDGRTVWLTGTYTGVPADRGKVVEVVALLDDVTDMRNKHLAAEAKVAAMWRSQAVIEFDLSGTVVDVNDHFLHAVGYHRGEVVGEHHRMFVDAEQAASAEYERFWQDLAAGEYVSGEFRRRHKDGSDLWLQATYNPILDASGSPVGVIKFATDVTADKARTAEFRGKIGALDSAQAVIEFDLEGTVLEANDNFLRAMGYSQREIVGQHHSMFCTADYVRTEEYRDFWLRLSKGEHVAGRFERVGKFGRSVHLQATYSPILDGLGRPVRVVKYAHDITEQVETERRVAHSTRAMTDAVAELAASIDQIGSSSQGARENAQQTSTDAAAGSQALGATLDAIAAIQRSSHSISEIVRVIAEIAAQTNLLAFNASIEAARAGEHGVGFSVVAGEVRRLAERSSEAAHQIGTLIAESASRIEEGSTVGKKAEEAFTRIVASVDSTGDAIGQIAEATSEQRQSAARVRELIGQLSTDHAA